MSWFRAKKKKLSKKTNPTLGIKESRQVNTHALSMSWPNYTIQGPKES